MAEVTVQQALQKVADNPAEPTEPIDAKVHDLVAHALFRIANNPDASVRGSMGRANKARRMIFNRLTGRRAAGTHPAAKSTEELEFVDLTIPHLEEPLEI